MCSMELRVPMRRNDFYTACRRPLPLLTLVLALAVGVLAAFPAPPALGQADRTELHVYIDELPGWASYAANVMYESTKYWEERIPGLKFYETDDPSQADFRVKWVKDFGSLANSCNANSVICVLMIVLLGYSSSGLSTKTCPSRMANLRRFGLPSIFRTGFGM